VFTHGKWLIYQVIIKFSPFLFTKSEQSLVSPLDLMNIKEFKNTI